MTDPIPDRARKGRGAVSNRDGRFEPTSHQAEDDGWGLADEELPALQTVVGVDRARHMITRNDSPDVGVDRTINPYRGCEHGCIYCFARPSHAYLGLSPGLDFETRLFAKPDAEALLRADLAKPSYKAAPVMLGANTDAYQPVERRLQITRRILGVLAETKHPVHIVTKSDLVLRDRDILAPMAAEGLVSVSLSLTSLDRTLARVMEPRAAAPGRRLAAMEGLAAAGVPVGVLTAPMIPAINDHEVEALLQAAHDAGARTAGYVLVRLALEIKDLFEEWLATHFPDRKARVLDLIRQTRGGQLYDSRFGVRMAGEGVYADLLASRFKAAARRLGFNRVMRGLDSSRFQPPPADSRQLRLL